MGKKNRKGIESKSVSWKREGKGKSEEMWERKETHMVERKGGEV